METEKLGQEQAYPNVAFDKNGDFKHCESEGHYGMSKRFYAACAAMQGFIASGYEESADVIAEMAYLFADALLKQENK